MRGRERTQDRQGSSGEPVTGGAGRGECLQVAPGAAAECVCTSGYGGPLCVRIALTLSAKPRVAGQAANASPGATSSPAGFVLAGAAATALAACMRRHFCVAATNKGNESPSALSTIRAPAWSRLAVLVLATLFIAAIAFCDARAASSTVLLPLQTQQRAVCASAAIGAHAGNPAVECATLPAATLQHAVAAVVHARERGGAVGRAFTAGELAAVHPCVRSGRRWSARHDVLYLLMGASFHLDRARALRATWARGLSRTLLIGDAADGALGMVTLPELEGKEDYQDAQHLTLRGLAYAMSLPSQRRGVVGSSAAAGAASDAGVGTGGTDDSAPAPWIMMVDDDTFVNTRELEGLLQGWDVEAPLIMGFSWSGPRWPRTYLSGGAGMLATRSAALLLARHLYTSLCPLLQFNDVTLGACAWKLGIAVVHSPLFDPEGEQLLAKESLFVKYEHDGALRAMATVHRAEPKLMHLLHEVVGRHRVDAGE